MSEKLEQIKAVLSNACKTCDKGFTEDIECNDAECPIGKIWNIMEET